MKDKQLDKLLREKLSKVADREMTPSGDLWSRLEGSISAAQEKGAIPKAAQEASQSPKSKEVVGSDVPTINIRRPRRPKTPWAYIAGSAAAVILLSLIITTLNFKVDSDAEPTIAEQGEQAEGIEIRDIDDLLKLYDSQESAERSLADAERVIEQARKEESQESESPKVTKKHLPTYKSLVASQTTVPSSKESKGEELKDTAEGAERVDGGTKGAEEAERTGSGAATIERQKTKAIAKSAEEREKKIERTPPIVIADVGGTTESKEDRGLEQVSTSQSEKKQADNVKTSDRKSRRKSAVYTVDIADYSDRKKQRTTPISTSLYAQGQGVGSGDYNSAGLMYSSANPMGTSSGYTQGDLNSDKMVAEMPIYRGDPTIEDVKHKLPISLGVSVSFRVWKNLHVETGLTYSYMSSEWKTVTSAQYKVTQKLHYIGLPIWLRYSFYNNPTLSLYGSVGGVVERAISAKQSYKPISKDVQLSSMNRSLSPSGLQLSTGANLGVEFKLSNRFSLYLEPGVNYYFDNKQPQNYRTENRFSFNLKAGFRINM